MAAGSTGGALGVGGGNAGGNDAVEGMGWAASGDAVHAIGAAPAGTAALAGMAELAGAAEPTGVAALAPAGVVESPSPDGGDHAGPRSPGMANAAPTSEVSSAAAAS